MAGGGGGGGGVTPKRNWLGRQNITQDHSWVGKKYEMKRVGKIFLKKYLLFQI